MRLYRRVNALPFGSSYVGKLFLVAFAGTHIPLLGAILYTAISELTLAQATPILLATLVATVIGVVLTFWGLYHLLAPIRATANALDDYVQNSVVPDLPTDFDDRVGVLMRRTQYTIRQLDELLQFQRRMLGVVSHDARGPASSILLAMDQISREVRSSDPDFDLMRSLSDRVEKAVEYQLDMSNSLLEMARFGEGKVDLDVESTTATRLLDWAHETHIDYAHDRNHTLTVDVETDGDGADDLTTDVVKVQQILSNLITNALKYTPKGGHVGLQGTVEDDAVVFAVRDDGPGIPESVRDRLYDAFAGNDASDASANDSGARDGVKSMGLGLWICRTFTDALGGQIDFETASGEGTTFTVRIPRYANAEDTVSEEAKASS